MIASGHHFKQHFILYDRCQLHVRMKLFQLTFVMLLVAVSVVAGKKGKKFAAALEMINNRLAAIEESLKQSKECKLMASFT